jgi:hypothetical protein
VGILGFLGAYDQHGGLDSNFQFKKKTEFNEIQARPNDMCHIGHGIGPKKIEA